MSARTANVLLIASAVAFCGAVCPLPSRAQTAQLSQLDVTGTWDVDVVGFGAVQRSTLRLRQSGSVVTGSLSGDGSQPVEISGSLESEILFLELSSLGYGPASMTLRVYDDALAGSIELDGRPGLVSAARAEAGAGFAPADDGGDEDPTTEDPSGSDVIASSGDIGSGGRESLGGGGPNEPAGYRQIAYHDGAPIEPTNWGYWTNTACDNEGYAESIDGVIVGHFPSGMGRPCGQRPFTLSTALHGGPELYMRFRIRLSSNWNGHASNVNKIGFLRSDDTPGDASPFVIMLRGSGSGRLVFAAARQNSCFSSAQENYPPNRGGGVIQRGQWHEVELRLRAPDQFEAWVDGVKTHDYRGTARMGCRAFGWDSWSLDPVWGGSVRILDRHQTMEIDYFYLSGR